MASYYRQQKDAVLSYTNDYTYLDGLPYRQIPTAVFGKGFKDAATDKRNMDVMGNLPENVPRDTNRMYREHAHMGDDRGFYQLSDYETAVELAPDFANFPLPQAGLVGWIAKPSAQGPGQDMENGARVAESKRAVDSGQPVGTMYEVLPPPKDHLQGLLHTARQKFGINKEGIVGSPFAIGWMWVVLGVAAGGAYIYFKFIQGGAPVPTPAQVSTPTLA